MNKKLATLVLVMLTAMVGCLSGPQVDKGGGESAVLEQVDGLNTGRINVSGHVVNSGGAEAHDVVLYFKFYQDGTLFLEETLLLGDISAGNSEDFSGTFFGATVTGVFTWEYEIDWD